MENNSSPNCYSRLLPIFLIGGLIFFFGFSIGSRHGANLYSSEVIGNVDFAPYWKTWNVLNDKFVSGSSTAAVSGQDRVWQSIVGLAKSYDDPYTVFFPPKETKLFEASISGNFEGVGMEIGMRDDIVTVISPLKGTPADRAGMMPGDQIIRIDGESTNQFTVSDAVQRIRGERGTSVILTILREDVDEPLEISIVRDVITMPSIDTELRDDGIFLIQLYNFTGQSQKQFKKALKEFADSGADKLILDLRGNPGGFLDAAVDMTSWFLPKGKVIVSEDFGDPETIHHLRSKGHELPVEDFKMVILIDGGSASASEILAGALSEHGVATLIGEQSFGKGSVQQVVNITSDTSLKVTIARWLTPNGVSISHDGITPDIEVSFDMEDLEAGEDPQLDRAIEFVNEK